MSLFKARQWWGHKLSTSEEFDGQAFCIGNLDNAPDGENKIATGSFSGLLRVVQPVHREFQPADVLLEKELTGPILQLEVGHFTTSGVKGGGLTIGVLHPRSFAVIALSSVRGEQSEEGGQEAGCFTSMKLVYELPLERTPANFCFGPFGSTKSGIDLVCIQSMDGELSIYDQEHHVFSRFLQNFLVPGPLCYVQRMDSFVTCNAQYEVECYKYSTLAASSGSHAAGDTSSTNKKLQVDWKIDIGEMALAIVVGRVSRALTREQIDIIVLGEHTLFFLKENGSIRMQKYLQYNPSCCLVFAAPDLNDIEGGNQHLLIATFDKTIMVYEDCQLIWSASTDSVPVALGVSSFGKLNGLISTLDDEGYVRVCYLGTEPQATVIGAVDTKELNYEEMDEEHKRLLQMIREATSEHRAEPAEQLTMRMQIPDKLDSGGPDDIHKDWQRVCITVKVFVSYNGTDDLDNVFLTVNADPVFRIPNLISQLPRISGKRRTPISIPLRIQLSTETCPSSLMLQVLCSYITPTGQPRTSSTQGMLPLAMAGRAVNPIKAANIKLTVGTNRPPPSLMDLFADVVPSMLKDSPNASAGVVSIMFHGGLDVTILSSKNGRYRVQGSALYGIWLGLEQLLLRLSGLFGADNAGEPFRISFTDELPSVFYFEIIDAHFECRKRIADLTAQLDRKAKEFRSIQKRLLIRFGDWNPVPLNNLDTLLERAFHQIIDLGTQIQAQKDQLSVAANRLSAATSVMLLLIRGRYDLDNESFAILSQSWTPIVHDNQEQGWEEVVEASLQHLLRTQLSKSSKDSVTIPHQAGMLADLSKLKKQMLLVCERLGKGIRMSSTAPSTPSSAVSPKD